MPAAQVGNWGRWGSDDERGVANMITPAKVLGALALPRHGRIYSLAQEIATEGVPMIDEGGPPLHLMQVDGGDYLAGEDAPFGFHRATDYLMMRIHGKSTHVDALGHVWTGEQIYNGFPSSGTRSSGMQRCGVDRMLGMITRGVLLDVPALQQRPHLDAGYEITPEDLQAAADAADVVIEAGDVVLVRTGWYRLFEEDREMYYGAHRPGIGDAAARWLAARDVAMVGADTAGVEMRPYAPETFAPVHQLLLRDYGIHLLEFLRLEELSHAQIGAFLFVMAPLRIRGGTGSPVNPLAVV